ncbi:nuclear transport factor 2 family protein [Tunturibacter empetritectus]|uniref:SnoaL-like domain-containing protein n=1 Tax=Tunturiibacter lichenicola TaxID=2051959 RepID=A0A7W8J7C3_9BACT|nr:nuclear transport factor 2 family protein [Edaphobacter lichenicola]MBB5343888.1 hypothetical protein [Edaphobacter lichenicola]
MTIDSLKQLMNSYQTAYAPDIAPMEQERLIRQSVSDDVVFSTPMAEGQGLANLLKHVAQFQKKNPGRYFKSNELLAHHGQLLSEWTMYNKDGSEFSSGHTHAHFNEEGRLTHLAGFFKA